MSNYPPGVTDDDPYFDDDPDGNDTSDCHHDPPCSTAQRAINHPEDKEEE